MSAIGAPAAPGPPDIRVLRGDATDEEVAAAVVAILARLTSTAAQHTADRTADHRTAQRRWAAPVTRMTRVPVQRGAGAWRLGL
ncbi:acyl-CoA carboxylase epsilon subunit [Streptomyces chattanoogensis]|uniref:Acetyl-CoA carboxylase n=1 Tax=Streptomyces chattanoogensis TaxID=66876 RepID=A0A0N1JX01_9ACTN|nr:acyl-CoA carboxylase epsilon subunit [Streptomyces chattanoogensis]KPC61353.1 hypothetical protein ADL29_24010 [Streptomyces chattanoogensis]